MSDTNETEGRECWSKPEYRGWFERQWFAWPKRVDERYTTNISFLYGGWLAYRDMFGCELVVSRDLRSHFDYLDRCDNNG